MTSPWEQWLLLDAPLLVLTAICTHAVMSCGQTLMHRYIGHRRLGGRFFRRHVQYHHAYYARGHLTSATYKGAEGNNTPYFLVPTLLLGCALYFILPFELFLTAAVASAASFYAHVYFDREYHISDSRFGRFAWFRRKQQLHFTHHLHANSNFAVIDFFWDRLLGTYLRPDRES